MKKVQNIKKEKLGLRKLNNEENKAKNKII